MEKSIVAVIEIGDLYSRCAISSVTDFKENPTKSLFLAFESPFHYPTHQLPTTIFLNEQQEFEAYGYDAEVKYYNLCKNGKHHNCFYFKHFRLQFGKSNRHLTVRTYDGKNEISFVFLISLIVRYFRSQILNYILEYTDITDDDIQWVLPIPDEWIGYYEGMFVQACYNGGLMHEHFSTVVESKAESTLKKYSYSDSSAGPKILVVDCGIRNIFPDHNFTDNILADALFENIGIWDCTPVDRILRDIFLEITGRDIVLDDRIPREERVDLYREIQYKIGNAKCSFKIPLVWRNEIDARLSSTNYAKKIRLVGDKLRFSDMFVFEIVQNALYLFLHNVLRCIEENEINSRCMYNTAGQYSGVPVIESVIAKTIQKKYKLPKECKEGGAGSISKGAAILGHVPTLIQFSKFRFRLHMKNIETPLTTEKDPKVESCDRETPVIKLEENATRANIWVPIERKDYPFKIRSESESLEDRLSQETALHKDVFLLTNPEKQISLTKQSEILDNMCDLYDNDWADHLEELLKQGVSEERSIEILLGILVEAYEECHKYIREQSIQIVKLFCPSASVIELQRIVNGQSTKLSDDLLQSVNSWRQTNKKQYISQISKCLSKSLESKFNLNSEDCCISDYYVKRNISNCWDMLCEEPPMYVDWKFQKGSEIDQSLLKLYTKNGRYVNFVVWPVIYSHKAGQVLKKGVVQPK